MAYRLLVSIEVIEFIERLPVKTREALRSAIHSIARDPLGRSDALDRDAIGRRMQIAVTGDYALMYWVDEADQHVKVLDIHAADQTPPKAHGVCGSVVVGGAFDSCLSPRTEMVRGSSARECRRFRLPLMASCPTARINGSQAPLPLGPPGP